ncbi:hypothetical protein ABZY90_29925 [Streptomyces sp. NPDC006422]|uniref:hypothetical protein n=1 Tax=unclassified Streptomyces TaxID=2593676 RepID=UPI0033BEEF3B
MALAPWDVQVKIGQLAAFAAAVATTLFRSARRRRSRGTAAPPKAPAPPTPLPAQVVPCRATATTAAAVTDLCTCVSELASDLAKRYADDGRRPPAPDAHT